MHALRDDGREIVGDRFGAGADRTRWVRLEEATCSPKLLRLFRDPDEARARRAATELVRTSRPGVHVDWRPALRAREPDRFVFAVFYTDPERPMRPAPYQLVAVAAGSYDASLLEPPRDSPYWIRNYK